MYLFTTYSITDQVKLRLITGNFSFIVKYTIIKIVTNEIGNVPNIKQFN